MAKEKKNPIKNFFAEFKKFITRGNVLDMAVGVIVGGAFTAIVTSISNSLLKPLVSKMLLLLPGDGIDSLYWVIHEVTTVDGSGKTVIDLQNSIVLNFSDVIMAFITFIITAFVLFLLVRIIYSVTENNKKLKADLTSTERKEIKKIRKEEKVSRKMAKAIYEQRVAEAEAKAAAEAKAKEEAEKAAAEEAARIAEEKANAPTVLLGEIRALLERMAPPVPEETTEETEATEEVAATEATETTEE